MTELEDLSKRFRSEKEREVEDLSLRYAEIARLGKAQKEPEPRKVDMDILQKQIEERVKSLNNPPQAEESLYYVDLKSKGHYFVSATSVTTNPDAATRVTQSLGEKIIRRMAAYPSAALHKTLPVWFADTAKTTIESVEFPSVQEELKRILSLALSDGVHKEAIQEVVDEVLEES
jgi:dTDP-4-amino-4,6-dideoxygalactose transaminase